MHSLVLCCEVRIRIPCVLKEFQVKSAEQLSRGLGRLYALMLWSYGLGVILFILLALLISD